MEEVTKNKKNHSGNSIGVRIVASILAFLMVVSVVATLVMCFIR